MSNKNKITLETRENKLEKIKKKGLRKTLFTTVMSMGMLLGCTGMLVGCGEAGPKGDTGAQGPQGEQGIQGEPGAAGAAGSMWFTGTAVSGTSNGIGVVVENAKVGDIYFNTTTCDIYVCTAENIWNWVSNIKGDQGIQGETGATGAIGPAGPQGPQGETGATGAAGADGATWLTGTAITGTGSNISVTITNAKLGDLYFNTSTCDLYQCVEENTWDWISNLKGDQGETGSAGVNGASWFTGTAITGTGTGISATIENTKVGDLYFNTETCNVYKCTALNTWDYLTSFKSEQTSPEATEIVVDLVMFMGQSNMAGRGDYTQATTVAEGHGYEFRAVSDPTKLYNIGGQAFGKDENRGVITESSKTGSMVPAFMESYYSYTGVPIVGVSAAKGGTSINWWQPDGNALNEAITRYNAAEEFLTENGYKIRHKYMVWCQGETDGDNAMDKDTYKTNLNTMINEMLEQGIEKAMIVRVGNHKTNATLYDNIIKAQTELCAESDDVVMVSGKLADMAEDGLMKDTFHYTQEGYNIAGADAGKNMAYYVNTGMEPYFYDRELDNYYPFGNYGSDSDTGTGGDTGSGDDTTGDDTTGDTTTESVVVNVAEATHDFASLGTVDGNKVTISSKSNTNAIQLTDVVLSDDYSWTIEMVVGNVVEGTTVLGCIGGTEGAGFITVPNMDPVNASSSTAQFRFRDKGKSLQLDFTIPTGYDAT
ncbi:MAG: hypothetical protein IJW25_02545, partial [Clostridia bacterium]|nr:hypothetical protein [Clostridia bacterium]